MELYLIRHTTPSVVNGTCYGQADLDVTDSFEEEVNSIRPHLPKNIQAVYSSPLQRCRKLAEALFPEHHIHLDNDLMELNCGEWEMRLWNDIPKESLQPWLENFIDVPVPGGESYRQLHQRVITRFEEYNRKRKPSVIVAHGGILRSILAHITQTPLKESFDTFTCHYGCVVKLVPDAQGIRHEMVYNVSLAGKEWHRPGKDLEDTV